MTLNTAAKHGSESNALVSVIIPNYNNADYLEQCIQSALRATSCVNGEVLIIDDCSTDHSLEVIQAYIEEIRLVKNPSNMGQVYTTNKGIELAKGKYSVILHSDDKLNENFFLHLVPLLEEFPTASMAVGEREEIDECGDKIHELASFYDADYLIPGIEQAKVFLKTGFLPCQVLFETQKLQDVGGADGHSVVNLDGLLWFKLALEGDLVYSREVVCQYRKHLGSTSSGLNDDIVHLFEYYSTLQKMFTHAKCKGVDLSQEFQPAFQRMAVLALRYGKEILASGHVTLSQQYKHLALAISPNIADKDEFKQFSQDIQDHNIENKKYTPRYISYSPPPGSIKLDLTNTDINTV